MVRAGIRHSLDREPHIFYAIAMQQSVKRRAVFFVGGYDPKTPEAFFGRMRKEIARFEALWGLKSTMSPVVISADKESGRVTIETASTSPGW